MATFATLTELDGPVHLHESIDEVSARLGHAISHGATLEVRSRSGSERLLINLGRLHSMTLAAEAGPPAESAPYTSALTSIFA
jgi:hypothetical protein